jgi:hypothetical protein
MAIWPHKIFAADIRILWGIEAEGKLAPKRRTRDPEFNADLHQIALPRAVAKKY